MYKKSFIKNFILILLVSVNSTYLSLLSACALFENRAWQPTIEEALEICSDDLEFERLDYQIENTIDKIYYNGSAYWLYEAKNGELCVFGFIKDTDADLWMYKGASGFGYIDNLFADSEDPEIGDYFITLDESFIYGVRMHDGKDVYVDDKKAEIRKTYEISYNENTYSIDWWDIAANIDDYYNLQITVE